MGDVLGPIMEDTPSQQLSTSSIAADNKTHDLYVQNFVSNLVGLFSE